MDMIKIPWNKVDLRRKDKNLPDFGEEVCWATLYSTSDGVKFSKFFGVLHEDGYVDSGIARYKLTSNFWWCNITDPETSK